MSTESAAEKKMHEVEDMVAQIDTGARNPEGWQGRMIVITAFIWALFQLYIASNLPFILQEMTGISFIVTSDDARLFHLSFAFLLALSSVNLFSQANSSISCA